MNVKKYALLTALVLCVMSCSGWSDSPPMPEPKSLTRDASLPEEQVEQMILD